MERIVNNEKELDFIVADMLKVAAGRKKFALSGDLGAGKTALAKAFCKTLGVEEPVTSPSFSIVNQYSYPGSDEKGQVLYHIDLYRLKNLQEALDIGLLDYLFDDNYCLIEWPEVAESLLPDDMIWIRISSISPLQRKILIL
jgi:tRNA threonylcarbamoyladenosine biosynthesis protein TsaE